MDGSDERIGVVLGPPARAGADDAVLAVPHGIAPGHFAGCACCRPRDAVAVALSRWYLARVRGGGRLPRRLVMPGASAMVAAEVERVLAEDPLLRARFRFDG